jgi:hypothetical protein
MYSEIYSSGLVRTALTRASSSTIYINYVLTVAEDSLLSPTILLEPLPDISGKVVDIRDAARHRAYWRLFRIMIAGLIELIQAEQSKITPAENADDVAANLVNQLLDLDIPYSDLLGLALLRYTVAYLLFEEQIDRDALVQVIKDI